MSFNTSSDAESNPTLTDKFFRTVINSTCDAKVKFAMDLPPTLFVLTADEEIHITNLSEHFQQNKERHLIEKVIPGIVNKFQRVQSVAMLMESRFSALPTKGLVSREEANQLRDNAQQMEQMVEANGGILNQDAVLITMVTRLGETYSALAPFSIEGTMVTVSAALILPEAVTGFLAHAFDLVSDSGITSARPN